MSFVYSSSVTQDKESGVINDLVTHKDLIIRAAMTVDISSRIVASTIYTERLLNYKWDDAILDNVLAKSGYNSSVGFSQIKLNTAFWIEEELNNPAGKYYMGNNIASHFKRSRSRDELIEKLVNDSTNIHFCAVYLAMIQKRWSKDFQFKLDNETGILATIYSLGVFMSNGEERKPHGNPQMNIFGKKAQEFYNGFILKEILQ